ncbi:Probable methyltransferase PMT10, partial [Linum perenne]
GQLALLTVIDFRAFQRNPVNPGPHLSPHSTSDTLFNPTPPSFFNPSIPSSTPHNPHAMKPAAAVDIAKTPNLVKLAAVFLLSLSVALLFYHHHPSFPSSAFSSFTNKSNSNSTAAAVNSASNSTGSSSLIVIKPRKKQLPPPPPSVVMITGIVDESGAMTEDFFVGEFDSDAMEELRSFRGRSEDQEIEKETITKLEKFKKCNYNKIDHIPCLESFERNCPNSSLDCVLPMPKGYKKSIPWPRSRDEVWLRNVPDTSLVNEQEYAMSVKDDKIVFRDGGGSFVSGVDKYLNLISQMVPDIDFGHRTRVALDIGSGIGSLAASLSQRNVTMLTIGTKDVHKNQIQLALERGVPAMLAVFGTRRLPFASQAFDLIHSSGSGIDWTVDNGILLLEVNRMLRAGRYFVWGVSQADNRDVSIENQWKEMEDLTGRLCWKLVKREGNVAIWHKPLNSSCYLGRDIGAQPPLCSSNDDPDNVWYVNMTACITPLPDDGFGSNVTIWPERLQHHPDRLQSIKMEASISRKELFIAESRYWYEIISSYVRAFHWKQQNFRNVIDMRAGFGGFAAAMHDLELASWVLNVVPVNGFNTLPVIYDRGLLGVMHDWCEPFDTYPRSYDLVHAAGLFSDERKRQKCSFSTILMEMDRMLRPGGTVYIRDSLAVTGEIHEIGTAMGWVVMVHDTGEGPHASWRRQFSWRSRNLSFLSVVKGGMGGEEGLTSRGKCWKSEEELHTYKRRKPTGSRGLGGGSGSREADVKLEQEETMKKPLDHPAGVETGSNDGSRGPWRNYILEQMYRSLNDDEGGIQGCIKDVLRTSLKASDARNKDERKSSNKVWLSNGSPGLPKSSHKVWLSNGSPSLPKKTVGHKPGGASAESSHHAVTDTFRLAFHGIISSEEFTSLCKLLSENFHESSADNVFSLSVINRKMKDGAYEHSPWLFFQDIQKFWKKLEEIGTELIFLVKSLSKVSEACFKNQVVCSADFPSDDRKQEVIAFAFCTVLSYFTHSGSDMIMVLLPTKKQLPTRESDCSGKADQTDAAVCTCRQCGRKAVSRDCLVCDSCEDMYHISCIEPAVEEIPPRSWYCSSCLADGVGTHDNCVVCERLSAPSPPDNQSHSAVCQTNEETFSDFGEPSEDYKDDDPHSTSEETDASIPCKICGSELESGEKVKICEHTHCPNKYYHKRCLTAKQLASHGSRWYCPSCLCRTCLTDKDDENIVLCDACDSGYHIYCLKPPLTSIPTGSWFCRQCMLQRQKVRRAREAYEKRANGSMQNKGGKRDFEAIHQKSKRKIEDVFDGREGITMLLNASLIEDKLASKQKLG